MQARSLTAKDVCILEVEGVEMVVKVVLDVKQKVLCCDHRRKFLNEANKCKFI